MTVLLFYQSLNITLFCSFILVTLISCVHSCMICIYVLLYHVVYHTYSSLVLFILYSCRSMVDCNCMLCVSQSPFPILHSHNICILLCWHDPHLSIIILLVRTIIYCYGYCVITQVKLSYWLDHYHRKQCRHPPHLEFSTLVIVVKVCVCCLFVWQVKLTVIPCFGLN